MVYPIRMKKSDAVALWGSHRKIARDLGISRQAVQAWPEELPLFQVDRLIGAAIRTGKLPGEIPAHLQVPHAAPSRGESPITVG